MVPTAWERKQAPLAPGEEQASAAELARQAVGSSVRLAPNAAVQLRGLRAEYRGYRTPPGLVLPPLEREQVLGHPRRLLPLE